MQIYIIWTHRFCEQHWVFPLLQHSSHCFCRQDLVCVGRTYSKSITCPLPRLININSLISSYSLGNRYNFESVGIQDSRELLHCVFVCMCACVRAYMHAHLHMHLSVVLGVLYMSCELSGDNFSELIHSLHIVCSEMKLWALGFPYIPTISLIPKQKETSIKKREKSIIIILNTDLQNLKTSWLCFPFHFINIWGVFWSESAL